MNKKVIKPGKTEIEKEKSHQYKDPISIYNVDINKIIVFNKVSFGKNGFKYFIVYKDGKKVRPLYVMLPNLRAYRKDFDLTKYMSFLIKNDELLENWDKVSNTIKKDSIVNLFTMKSV